MSEKTISEKIEEEVKAEDILADRIAEFLREYGELTVKHKIDFAQYPVWIPDGTGGFKTVLQNTPIDMSQMPQKSPFIG